MRQQQRRDADVDQQHDRHCVVSGQRDQNQRGGDDVDEEADADARGELGPHAVGGDQHRQCRDEIGERHALAEAGVGQMYEIETDDRTEHEAGVDNRLETAIKIEEIEFAPGDVARRIGGAARPPFRDHRVSFRVPV